MKVNIIPTGKVYVSRIVPFGAKNLLDKAVSVLSKREWIWLPVTCYLIEHSKKKILVDTGWDRSISPDGNFTTVAQASALGSRLLPMINQGWLPKGEAIDEQLYKLGLTAKELDYVLLTHLDCDHACGLHQVAEAKNILVSNDEMEFANNGSVVNRIRYQSIWWNDTPIQTFEWTGNKGPFAKSYDLLGDGSIELINIPGHSAGLSAVKVSNPEGKYVLIVGDGAYGRTSWEDMILPGISENVHDQRKSLEWIRECSFDQKCIEILACHDVDIKPHTIKL